MNDYYNLGTHTRPITTDAPDAQVWFDRGLMWLYGYNHEEAVSCFRKAVELDEGCVMAHWGIAYGLGCNYNKEWKVFSSRDIPRVLSKARKHCRS